MLVAVSAADPGAAPSNPPATDVVAGRFALCDPIGSGGSGTVWRAWDRSTRHYCAAKLLRRRDAGQLLRFVREQSVRLTGDHLASPYAWAAEESDVLIASELVDGGSLHTLLGDYGPLAEGTIVVLLDQLLGALADVHAAGLVHRDVKTGNVLLVATGTGPMHLLLTDFGLAISERDARFTEVGTVIGTPGYLAPEVLSGAAVLSPAQDLYAAGRLAAALLTGQDPRFGDDAVPDIADPALRAAVTALLADDPAARPESAQAAGDLLDTATRDLLPRTADGDEVEVLRQLPELPVGWDPRSGPNAGVRLHEHGGDTGPTRSAAVLASSSTPARSVADTVTDVPPTGEAPVRAPSRGTTGAPGSAPRTPWWRPWVLTVLAAALVGIATYSIAEVVRTDPAPSPPGVSGSTVPDSTGSTGSAGSTAARSPAETSDAATVPAGTAPTPGQACSFQEEGNPADGPAGAVVCRRVDGGYAWATPAGTTSTAASTTDR